MGGVSCPCTDSSCSFLDSSLCGKTPYGRALDFFLYIWHTLRFSLGGELIAIRMKYAFLPPIRLFTLCLTMLWTTSGVMAVIRDLPMEEAIRLARRQSVASATARNRLRAAHWRYVAHRANLLPEVSFTGYLPDFKRGYNLYQNAEGGYQFVRTNLMKLNGELSLVQNIPWTGGTIGIATSLERVTTYGKAQSQKFLTVPVSVTLTQPIFGVNTFRWENKIEPLRYKEAQLNYRNEVEQTTRETIRRYFDLLIAQERLASAQQNERNAHKLHEIAQIRLQNGEISANDERRLQLNLLSAQSTRTDEETHWRTQLFRLQSYLGVGSGDTLRASIAELEEQKTLRFEEVMRYAKENHSFERYLERTRLEAEYSVAKAKGKRYQIDLFASVGYTGQNEQLSPAYENLIDNQQVKVGLRIPLLDWGKRKGEVRTAEWDREVVETQLQREAQTFEQDIYILVERYNNQQSQLRIAEASDSIAQLRYQTSIEVFLLGKIGVLELNDAQLSKDNARLQRIRQLWQFWDYFYRIRALTLHDFTGIRPLENEIEELVRD